MCSVLYESYHGTIVFEPTTPGQWVPRPCPGTWLLHWTLVSKCLPSASRNGLQYLRWPPGSQCLSVSLSVSLSPPIPLVIGKPCATSSRGDDRRTASLSLQWNCMEHAVWWQIMLYGGKACCTVQWQSMLCNNRACFTVTADAIQWQSMLYGGRACNRACSMGVNHAL